MASFIIQLRTTSNEFSLNIGSYIDNQQYQKVFLGYILAQLQKGWCLNVAIVTMIKIKKKFSYAECMYGHAI